MHLQHQHLGNNFKIAVELVSTMPVFLGKMDNMATGMGFSRALPAGKEPLGEGSTLGRWSITIDCMGLWLATRIQQSLVRVLVVGIKLINVLLAKLAQITSKALRISPKSQTS